MRGQNTLRRIAVKQAQEAAPAGERKAVDRPVLHGEGVLDRVWSFLRNTLTRKSLDDQLKEDKAVLAAAFEERFLERCRTEQTWFTAADIAGGPVFDPETGQTVELATGDVQWQEQVKTRPVHVGAPEEKKLNAAARALMPEQTRLVLKDLGDDPGMLDALVQDLGEERIKRWFEVVITRRPLTSDQVRELYFKNAAGRKTVESMIAAGAVELVGYPKVMRDPRSRAPEG